MDLDQFTSFLEYNGRALTLHFCSLFYKLKIDAGPKPAAFCTLGNLCEQTTTGQFSFLQQCKLYPQKPVKRRKVCSALFPCSQGIITALLLLCCSEARGYRCRQLENQIQSSAQQSLGCGIGQADVLWQCSVSPNCSFVPNGPAVMVPGEWQCQETSILGDAPLSFLAKGYSVTQPRLKNLKCVFQPGKQFVLGMGQYRPLPSLLPHQASHRIRNHRVIQRSEVCFRVCFWSKQLLSKPSEALPGAYGKAADQPLIPICGRWQDVSRGSWELLLSPYVTYSSHYGSLVMFSKILQGVF